MREGMTGQACVSLACGIAALCAASSASACRNDAVATQRVEFSVGYVSPGAFRTALTRQHAKILGSVAALRIARIRLAPSEALQLRRRSGIRFVERVTQRLDAVEPALLPASGKTAAWEWQFAAAREDAVPDWVLRAASSITIAAVDTGADVTAPDIAAKDPVTFSPRTGTADVRDIIGHGTFVAALAAGSVTNGDGIAGFGGDAKLMIVKAGAGDGSLADVDEAAAIAYAVDHGARIINLSFGGTTTSTTERNAIDYATTHGALVVAAAGNHYLAGNPVIYPAALVQPLGSDGVGGAGLSVGASTATGTRAAFSNAGTYLSLAAPGDGVFSAVSSTSLPTSFPRVLLPGSARGLYGYGSGTSFAAPEVAGAAALVMAANPLLSAQDVARVLKESASGGGTWSRELGYGVLDVAKAVDIASGTRPEIAQAGLSLAVRIAKHRVHLAASLSSLVPGVSTAARTVVFDRYSTKRKAWSVLKTIQTRADGKAVLTVHEARTRLRFRARWAGSTDLSPAASKSVVARALGR